MTFIQRFFTAILPRSLAASMEAESQAWKVRCETCGAERSVWDIGGIRWKARGNSSNLLRCQACGRARWHRFRKA